MSETTETSEAPKISLRQKRQLVRRFRKQMGLRLAELAERGGMTEAMLSLFENGKANLSDASWARLCTAMETHLLGANAQLAARIAEAKRTAMPLGVFERIAKLEKIVGVLSGVKDAEHAVSRAKSLPWLRSTLAREEEILASRKAQMQKLTGEPASLDDPIIKELLESYEKEIEALAAQAKDMEDFADRAGFAAMRFTEAVQHGEQEACEYFSKWQETGEAPTLSWDRIVEEFREAEESRMAKEDE